VLGTEESAPEWRTKKREGRGAISEGNEDHYFRVSAHKGRHRLPGFSLRKKKGPGCSCAQRNKKRFAASPQTGKWGENLKQPQSKEIWHPYRAQNEEST